MSNTKLYVGRVIHSSFVEVNEEGTEAAAVTAIAGKTGKFRGEPFTFRADRPFVFAIQKMGVGLLFVGCVRHPK